LIYEAIVIGIAGCVFGYGLGTLLAFITGPLIFEGVHIAFIPVFLPLSLGLAISIAVLSTLYPAYRAARIRVADSFRSL
jgi:putative ABC transport system permease protein